MAKRTKFILSVILLTLVLDVICWILLPTKIAVHWDASGMANGFLPTWKAVLLNTAVMALGILIWNMLRMRFSNLLLLELTAGKTAGRSVRILVNGFGGLCCSLGILLNLVLLIMN